MAKQQGRLKIFDRVIARKPPPLHLPIVEPTHARRRGAGRIEDVMGGHGTRIGTAKIHRVFGDDELEVTGLQPEAVELFASPVVGGVGGDDHLRGGGLQNGRGPHVGGLAIPNAALVPKLAVGQFLDGAGNGNRFAPLGIKLMAKRQTYHRAGAGLMARGSGGGIHHGGERRRIGRSLQQGSQGVHTVPSRAAATAIGGLHEQHGIPRGLQTRGNSLDRGKQFRLQFMAAMPVFVGQIHRQRLSGFG